MGKFYISTIDEKAGDLARRYGLGIEIAQYCTAWNMDEQFPETDALVRADIRGIEDRVLHAPFSELFPCAVDPKIRAVAAQRYGQAMALAGRYQASKVIIHGGFNEHLYFPSWYVEQSTQFWKAFLRENRGAEIVLENVLEPEPEMLVEIVKAVDDPRLRLCLDVGHANAYSKIPPEGWLEACAPWISHFHIHNNDGSCDSHSPLGEGTIPMQALLEKAAVLCPNATYTLELMEAESSLRWLHQNHFRFFPEEKGDTL